MPARPAVYICTGRPSAATRRPRWTGLRLVQTASKSGCRSKSLAGELITEVCTSSLSAHQSVSCSDRSRPVLSFPVHPLVRPSAVCQSAHPPSRLMNQTGLHSFSYPRDRIADVVSIYKNCKARCAKAQHRAKSDGAEHPKSTYNDKHKSLLVRVIRCRFQQLVSTFVGGIAAETGARMDKATNERSALPASSRRAKTATEWRVTHSALSVADDQPNQAMA